MTSIIGAMNFITTTNIPSALNFDEILTSSIIVFGFIIYPTNTQVKNADIGMSTLLLT